MRVAITRPKGKEGGTKELASSYGFEVLIVNAIELVPRGKEEVRAAVGKLADYDWVIITSAFGAKVMHRYFGDALRRAKVAAVGEKTRRALEKLGIRVALTPQEFRSEGLVEALREAGAEGKRILVARASAGRELLVMELGKFAEVVEVPIYDSRVPEDRSSILALREALEKGEVKAAIFTSAQTVRNIFSVIGNGKFAALLNRINVVAIAPETKKTLESFGVKRVAMPERYTLEECLKILKEAL